MRNAFWEEIEGQRARWDALAHPFCRRWLEGELTDYELKAYASEYDHAVVAIATASRRAAELGGPSLAAHADEEEEHVRLWRQFAKAAGWGGYGCWGYAEEPLAETEVCARVWAGEGDRELAMHLVSLYVIESAQAELSGAKLRALRDHYGFAAGPETEYFRLHARLDSAHAAAMRAALDAADADASEQLLLAQAEAVGRAHWRLLDGVQQLVAA